MTQAKHTPGPWHMMLTKDGYQIGTGLWEDWGNGDMAFSEFQIATVWACMEEANSNARLIAAAPDLLEALLEIRDMLWSRPDISERLRPLMGFAEEATNQKAAAAIAKAKGGAA
jgi:hypothetical protein